MKNAADYLSRSPCSKLFRKERDDAYIKHLIVDTVPKNVSIADIQKATERRDLQAGISAINSNKWHYAKPFKQFCCELSVYDGIVMKGNQIIIQKRLQQSILDTAHMSHQGIINTKALLREKVWWPKINTDVENLVSHCLPCQATAPATMNHAPLTMTKLPKKPWSVLAADLQGLYPTGEYLFMIINYRSKYPIVVKPKNTISTRLIVNLDSNKMVK